jgi:hypothetical protein
VPSARCITGTFSLDVPSGGDLRHPRPAGTARTTPVAVRPPTTHQRQNAYGLCEQFYMGGSADGDLVGQTRTPGGSYGNAMAYDTDNGPVGNTQIPVLFTVGANNASYGMFLDKVQEATVGPDGRPVDGGHVRRRR